VTKSQDVKAEAKTKTTIFTRESSYCFQRVLAIAILSVCLSVCHRGGSVKNGASYDPQIFIVGCVEDSIFRIS